MINTHCISVEKNGRLESHGGNYVDGSKKITPRLHIQVEGTEILFYFDGLKELRDFRKKVLAALREAENAR